MMSAKFRLCVMMFLQYFVWGAWGVALGGYMSSDLGFTPSQIGAVFACTPIAAMISPLFLTYFADRFFSTEKLLGVLHVLGAGLLFLAARSENLAELLSTKFSGIDQFAALRWTLIAYSLLFMPTLALSNAISFRNVKSIAAEFPFIRAFGTLGWIAAGLVVGFIFRVKPDDATYKTVTNFIDPKSGFFSANNFIYLASAASTVLGLFCFFLPHTPPAPRSEQKSSGGLFEVLALLKSPSFLVFTIASFIVCIPLMFYYSMANAFLEQIDAPYPTALQTIGQICEVFFMLAMPFFITMLGVKKMLAVGMLAWVVRYLLFGTLMFPPILLGLILHGICYDFFFVASQIYVDSKAPETLRSLAQGFIAFVTLGVGMFVGSKVVGEIGDRHPGPRIAVVNKQGVQEEETDVSKLPDWQLAGDKQKGIAKQLKLGDDDRIELDNLPDTITDDSGKETRYFLGKDVAKVLKDFDEDKDGRITRAEYRKAQRDDWLKIWLWPAGGAAVALIFFWLGFHDKVATRDA